MQSSAEFDTYCRGLLALGHDRHWIRRNEPALRQRFALDDRPFPPPPLPDAGPRDRYDEL